MSAPIYSRYPVLNSGSGGVTSLNSLTGALTLSPGTGISFSTTGNTITINATGGTGTVTSVGLSDASTVPIYGITNSPITTSGSLTLTLNTQSVNTVLAGPTTGASAQPSFRSLVSADLPPGTGTVTSVGLSVPSYLTGNWVTCNHFRYTSLFPEPAN